MQQTTPKSKFPLDNRTGHFLLFDITPFIVLKNMDQDDPLIKSFLSFHQSSPEIYKLFKKIAFEFLSDGANRLSAANIIQIIRNFHKKTVNNNHHPYYERLFLQDHPQYADYFELRHVRPQLSLPKETP